MTIKEAKTLIKDYYRYQNEKVNSVRKVTCEREVLDGDDNVVDRFRDEAFICNITEKTGTKIATLCYMGRDAKGKEYAVEFGSDAIGNEQDIIDEWSEV